MNDYSDMTAERYLKLYSRFQKKPIVNFVFAFCSSYQITESFLDLCCGPAQVAKCLLEMGVLPSNITCADISDFRTSDLRQLTFCILRDQIRGLVGRYDHIFCRQAILYWYSKANIEELYTYHLGEKGTFLFNVPLKPLPNICDTFWKGNLDSFEFTQTTGNGRVYHLQSFCGEQPHLNSFLNLGYENIKEDLFDIFGQDNVKVKVEGNSATVLCTKE